MGSLTVLYIAGTGRSGSTLLDRILGTIGSAVSGGEMRQVWRFGLGENALCSCGQRFGTCAFWRDVLLQAHIDSSDAPAIVRDCEAIAMPRYWLVHWLGWFPGRLHARLCRALDGHGRLYRAFAAAAQAEVIVDSSKHASRALLLYRIPGIDLQVVHLVRDPRACSYSWLKPKYNPGRGVMMPGYSAWWAAVRWLVGNLMVETLRLRLPVRRVTYEALMRDPRDVVESIALRVPALAARPAAFTGEHEVDLPMIHVISGNPDRFASGRTQLASDSRFLEGLTARQYWSVTLLTLPLLWLYGYPLGRGHKQRARAEAEPGRRAGTSAVSDRPQSPAP